MRVSALTPTNGRPEALELCKSFVERQTYPVYEHLIEEGRSLGDNLRELLKRAQGDVFVIFEDDDHYKPGWVEYVVQNMVGDVQLVGENCSNYYHLELAQHCPMQMASRSSLCSTAIRSNLRDLLLDHCHHVRGLDTIFWNTVNRKKIPFHLNTGPDYFVTGMKGLPGTPGMGVGHRKDWYRSGKDQEYAILEKWVGKEDADMYRRLLETWKTLGRL